MCMAANMGTALSVYAAEKGEGAPVKGVKTFNFSLNGDYTTHRFIRESRQTDATSWRVTCAGGPGGATGDALCQTYSITCSALAP